MSNGWEAVVRDIGHRPALPSHARPKPVCWKAALAAAPYPPSSGPGVLRTFSSEAERFAWERVQWKYYRGGIPGMGLARGDFWHCALGYPVWGYPIPPWATVYDVQSMLTGFRIVNADGLGPMGWCLRRLFAPEDGPVMDCDERRWKRRVYTRPEYIRAVLRYPHGTIAGAMSHALLFDVESVAKIEIDRGLWLAERKRILRGRAARQAERRALRDAR